jgi:hypothetical protein
MMRDAALQDPDRDRDVEGLAAIMIPSCTLRNISIAFLLPSSGVVKTSTEPKEESDKDEKAPTF